MTHYYKYTGFTYFFFFLQHIGQFNKFLYGFYLSAKRMQVCATTTAVSFQDEAKP